MLPGESANHKLACHVDYWWSSADEDRLEVITSGVAVLQLMSVSSGTTAEAHSAAVTVNTTEKVTGSNKQVEHRGFIPGNPRHGKNTQLLFFQANTKR